MRIAVYDRFWSTIGGGERFAAGIAEALAGRGDVVLLAHHDVDLEVLGERLGVDLSAVGVEVVGDDPDAVTRASSSFDLLVNASYLSADRNAAAHGIYVVHFPARFDLPRSRTRQRLVGAVRPALTAGMVPAELVAGAHPAEPMRRHTIRWTGGDARIEVAAPAGRVVPVRVLLGRYLPGDLDPVDVEVLVDGRTQAATRVVPVRSRFDRRRIHPVRVDVRGRDDGRPVEVALRSSVHVPAERGASGDDRRLGVPVVAVAAGSGPLTWFASRVPALWERAESPGFLSTYDAVVANSEFTAGWIGRLWGRSADVLNPPVGAFAPGPKEPVIASVGRFFGSGGHSKKQLELVEAFRRLVAGGVRGWELHLAGGCAPEHRPYLEQVRRAARGLPVVIHVDVTGAELAALYARASLYWHATGLGEDPHRHPDRFEHFGITTVEAMSAGAVPVVIAHAGQLEVVEHGVSGFHFADLDDLVRLTRRLVGDPAEREQLSAAARVRARRYHPDAFAERLHHLVDEVVG